MIYIVIKTLLTAIVIVVISEIAKRSTLLAGLLASLPLTSFLAFIWLYWEKRDSELIINLSNSILLMIIPSLIFFIALPVSIKLNFSFIFSMIISTIITGIAYWLFSELLNKFGIIW